MPFGAILTALVSLLTDNLIIQMAVFVISSTILIFATKPFVKKFLNKNDSISTNAFSIIGKHGIVIQDIDSIHSSGQVKVEGEVWSAIGVDNVTIPQNTEVEIKKIKGVKVVVSPIQK